MTVSVIIPVYNVKPYLERCIKSVQGQTYKDFEVILVDDGSTDGSGEMCDHFASTDKRISVVHQENHGLSYARNIGVKQAKGEYIIFIDSDDEWLFADGLQQVVEAADPQTDLVAFKIVHIYGNQHQPTKDYDIHRIEKMSDAAEVFAHLVYTQQFNMSACPLMVRRELLVDNNIIFPIGIISEDIFWSMHLWQYLHKVRFMNLNLYGYHHRQSSISTIGGIHSFHSYDYIFTYWQQQCDAGCKNANEIRAYLADMWVNRGYRYYTIDNADKPVALSVLTQHVDLLNYGRSTKARMSRWLVSAIGIRRTTTVLKWYCQLKAIAK